MRELAYPEDHPAHPANAGKKFSEPMTALNCDYEPGHPARGGLGQAVPMQAAGEGERDGLKHLHGLPGATLAERQKSFEALPEEEKEARLKWNKEGIPATPEEE